METQLVVALVGFVGVVIGLLGRDVFMALFLARQRRIEELQDRSEERVIVNRDLVRIYSDPLLEAVKSLRFRLDEIIEAGRAQYLLAAAARTTFNEYKRLSTIYRLAAILGWIRAFRRERSYLDPREAGRGQDEQPILGIERALADGQHVEQQRLDELLHTWRLPNFSSDQAVRLRATIALDGLLQEFLKMKGTLSAVDLSKKDKIELAKRCAEMLTATLKVDVPEPLVVACADQVSALLNIREAYIYRDWQTALGDLMIVSVEGAPRRFDVIGYGEFETRYLNAHSLEDETSERRWFDRLETLFHDLDISKEGLFDARRAQIRNLREACLALEKHLTAMPITH
jgi:hypothetical protein